ncbi:MAG: hypothetical protein HQL25_02400 [Candidatus Omnitrophica bacterium]|nr:hypothetical protein [Candidatus Omnitrophota bacterium]
MADQKKYKPVWLLGVIIIVVAVAAFLVNSFIVSQKRSAEDFLPSKVLIYVKASNIKKNLESLFSLNLWSQFSRINFNMVAAKLAKPGQKNEFKGSLTDWEAVVDNEVFKKFLSQEAVLAVYPINLDTTALAEVNKLGMEEGIRQIMSNIYLVTKVTSDVQFLELFSGFLNDKNVQGVTIEHSSYRGAAIHTIVVPDKGIRLCFVRFGKWVALGFSEDALKKLVDVSKGSKSSLASDRSFIRHLANAGKKSDLDVFVNVEILVGMAKDYISSFGAKQSASALKYFDGYRSFALAGFWGDPNELNGRWSFDRGSLSPDMQPFFEKSGSKPNNTLAFVPEDVLAYHWDGYFSAEKLWDYFKKSEQLSPSAGNFSQTAIASQMVKGSLGLDLETQIIPAIGDEWGGYWSGIEMVNYMQQKIPMPKFLFFLKMKQKEIFEQMLAKFPLPTKKEEYEGYTINSLQLPMGAEIQPAYCYKDDYFLLSLHASVIKQTLELAKSGQGLKNSEEFKTLDKGLTSMGRSFDYFGMERLFKVAKELVGYGNDFITRTSEQRAAFKKGAQNRLEDYNSKLTMNQTDLSDAEAQLKALKEEVKQADKADTKIDLTEKYKNEDDLQKKISSIKMEISGLKDKVKTAEETIKNMRPDTTPPLTERNFYLDNLIYPLLNALTNIKNMAIGASIDDDNCWWRVFYQVQ